jgi:hypothetical protein
MPNASCPPLDHDDDEVRVLDRLAAVGRCPHFGGHRVVLIMRETNVSMRRSFVSVGLMRANSLSCNAGVARMSVTSVLQNTTDPTQSLRSFSTSQHPFVMNPRLTCPLIADSMSLRAITRRDPPQPHRPRQSGQQVALPSDAAVRAFAVSGHGDQHARQCRAFAAPDKFPSLRGPWPVQNETARGHRRQSSSLAARVEETLPPGRLATLAAIRVWAGCRG